MANRYLVTGCQIGMIKGYFDVVCRNPQLKNDIQNQINALLSEILMRQYSGESENLVTDDSKKILKLNLFNEMKN